MAVPFSDLSNAIRALAMDAVEAAKSGHPGMPMGMADVMTVLFTEFLRHDPANPQWPDRDRFILSAGHGSMLLYAALHLSGYADFPLDTLKRFRQLGSYAAGHPEFGHGGGVETTTGPLGQGISNAVGFALAERHLNARFGDGLVNHKTYVIASYGDLMEGISHEAASLAGHLKLSNLIVLFDDNGISIDGPTALALSDNEEKRFEAYGWKTLVCDGHDPAAIRAALTEAQGADRPVLISCRTTIGKGAPTKAGKSSSHGSPLGAEELAGAKANLGWAHGAFDVPTAIRAAWAEKVQERAAAHVEWTERTKADAKGAAALAAALSGNLPASFDAAMLDLRKTQAATKPVVATRKASETALGVALEAVPEIITGSADLTGSVFTKTAASAPIAAGQYGGRFVHWGVREHAMAAAMNGMALHGGVIPVSGTFLVFSDYCRPSIRLSALMGQRVVYVMTHDSIGVGEDGPTHQPVEHLASLRAIPNLVVLRPADAVETAEAWQLALERKDGPTLLALTRQNLKSFRSDDGSENLSAKGGYVLAAEIAAHQVTIFATGSEVEVAMGARDLLEKDGIGTRVVSLPCVETFLAHPPAERARIAGKPRLKMGVEAGISLGWERVLGESGIFAGMPGFGASGPINDLYRHFGITAERVAERARAALS